MIEDDWQKAIEAEYESHKDKMYVLLNSLISYSFWAALYEADNSKTLSERYNWVVNYYREHILQQFAELKEKK